MYYIFKQIALVGLTPDSVFCLKPETGAGGGGLKKNMKRQTDPYGKAMKK